MILVTGASSGIGEACAELLCEKGHDLFLTARRIEKLTLLRDKLIHNYPQRKIEIARLDVSDKKTIDHFFQTFSDALSRVTVLLNNAGLARGLEQFQESSPDSSEEMIATNLTGLLHMTRRTLPLFIEQKKGHVINMGSVAGQWFYPKGGAYCATKAAVHAFSESLRHDLLGTGIRVTEIIPGMVETEFSEVRLGDKSKAKQVYAGMTPLCARDIAEAVLFAIDRPKHVNIQEIVIYPTDQASPMNVYRS